MKIETYKPQFTFGFEIEGVFSKRIYNTLDKLDCEHQKKGDGSVRYSDIIFSNRVDMDDIECSIYTEYNVGVFDNEKDLLRAMEVFKNKENYFMDKSCGLHLHIKPKTEIKKGKELFWDLDLIKKLEKFAYGNLCECQKKREQHFCEKYSEFTQFYRDYQENEKYRFVRNHPSGTMEFRFFCPCEHKVNNVKKFLGYLNMLMSKQKPRKSALITLEIKEKVLEQDFSFALSVAGDKNYDFRLGEDFDTIIPPRNVIHDEPEEHEYDEDCNCAECEEYREDDSDNGDRY